MNELPNQEQQNLILSLRDIGLHFQCNTTLYQELSPEWSGHCGLGLLTPNIQIQKTISENETTNHGSLIHNRS